MLIDSGFYKQVVIIPAGIGATSIQCWSDGDCNLKLMETLDWMHKDKIIATHIIWHQGESDNLENTSKEVYKSRLKKIVTQIRNAGQSADFYVCTASYHPSVIGIKDNGNDTLIQQAQTEFVNETPGTCSGANTDLLNLASDRYDGVHFSRTGLDKFARELYNQIMRKTDNKP
jgi:lysophospholipase L1-like esterase